MIKVSVIVPIYNTEKYLEECINSILCQTLQEIEIILVNDGSPKNADVICKKYLEKSSKIKYIYQKNQGVSVARNNGLKFATGDYIYFMDSDDTIAPDFLEIAYITISEFKSELAVLGNYCRITACGCAGPMRLNVLPTCGAMISRNLFIRYPDIRFPEHVQPCEDGILMHKILAIVTRISYAPNCIYNHRIHENSNSVLVNNNGQNILVQIPLWLKNLNAFYEKYRLLPSKAFHLLRFLEIEPYSTRYCFMDLTNKERCEIFNLIHEYCDTLGLIHMVSHEQFKLLSKDFRLFITSKSFKTYMLKAKFIERLKKIKRLLKGEKIR